MRAKANIVLNPRSRLPRTHATKRSGGKKANIQVIPAPHLPSATARKKPPVSGRREVNHELQSNGEVHPEARKKSKSLAEPEEARLPLLPKKKMPSVSAKNKSARQDLDVVHDLVASGKDGGHALADTRIGDAAVQSFPVELLQNYSVYRQIQKPLVALKNQITALKKFDPTNFAIMPLLGMLAAGQKDYKAEEKKIVAHVRSMPIWEWAKGVRGIAESSLGQILSETGDLSKYANPSKVWKRMGLALVRGHRQQFWAANRKGFTRTENVQMAVDMGYSARRRALMAVVGSNLIRTKNVEYGKLYRDRKEFEREKLIAEHGPKYKSLKSHAHKRALRYMEKRFLLNLWKAWRGHH